MRALTRGRYTPGLVALCVLGATLLGLYAALPDRAHPIIALTAGLALGIPIALLLRGYASPVLELRRVEWRVLDLRSKDGTRIRVLVNRVVVGNRGRSAAADCKAYVSVPRRYVRAVELEPEPALAQRSYYRINWVVAGQPTVSVNVRDEESFDSCAIAGPEHGHQTFLSTEHGWPETIERTRALSSLPPEGECFVVVTASNAAPVARVLQFSPGADQVVLGGSVDR